MKKQLFFVGLMLMAVLAAVFVWKNRTESTLFEVMKVPEFELTDQNGSLFGAQHLKGKIYIVEFFFTNCPTICPIMSQNLKAIKEELQHPDLEIVSITIDPKRDTPETLKRYAENMGVSDSNWHFLTADRDEIMALSKKFNIYVGEDTSTAEALEHSGKVALVNREGFIVSRYKENGLPLLYYSAVNYKDAEGKQESLSGAFHPEIDWLKEDAQKLLND